MKKILVLIVLSFTIVFASAQDVRQIRMRAEEGDAYSQYLMGYYYRNGTNDLPCDYSKARIWFEKSANNRYAPAAYYLGLIYFGGLGVPKDVYEAEKWFGKAKQLGYRQAQQMLETCKKDIAYSSKQNDVTYSTPKTDDNFDPSKPPLLELIENSIKFEDSNGNNAIDADEGCYINFQIANRGNGIARNCVANITSSNNYKGLYFESKRLHDIAAGDKINVSLYLKSDLQIASGSADLIVQVNEPHGFGTEPVHIVVNTKQFMAPRLRVVDYSISSSTGDKLAKKQPFDVRLLLQNVEHGTAENVSVYFNVPEGVYIMSEGGNKKSYNSLNGGATVALDYSLIVSDNFKGASIPIDVKVKERYGRYAEDRHLELQLNQTLASNRIEVKEIESGQESFTIETASLTSDVDKNIPEVKAENADNTFAVVIANESYNKEAGVPFAANDGKIFAEYCKKTIGLSNTHVHLSTNATLNDMKHEIRWLRQVMETRKGEAKVIFYYAGHGIPDEKEHQAYLLPIDGYGSDISTGYSLNNLYKELGEIPSKSIIVLLDACFSGAKRDGAMLASARGIALKVSRGEPRGNMVVISAAQGDETAFPYKKEGHGLFTYFLLKKMQETRGNVTLKELGDYLTEKVSQQSIVVNSKTQTPTVIVSNSIADDWRSWKLK